MANIIEVLLEAQDNMSGVVNDAFGSIQSAGTVAIGAFAAIGAGALAAGAGIMGLARNATGLQDARAAFTQLAETAGTSSDMLLYSLQQASGGMIDQQTLMLEYNNASTIMGSALAGRLPEAMQYLDRISDATGRDMTGMIDTLIGSVGRLRPTMLAQMGITVDATTAYETYAASIGKTADQLTESEQQTALFNAAVGELQRTAETLPDVADSAGDSFSIMDTNLTNLGQNISTLFIPAGQNMANIIAEAARVGNVFVTAIGERGLSGALRLLFANFEDGSNYIGGILETFGMAETDAYALGESINNVALAAVTFFDAISQGAPLVTSLTAFFSDLGAASIIPPEAAIQINNLITGIGNILTPIVTWIQNNVQLSDVLTALGIAIGSVVIPAVIALAAPFLPIIATFGALVLAASLVRQAWETDFGGIQTFVTTQALPGLQNFFTWLGNVWTTQVQPGLTQLWTWFTVDALPAVVNFVNTVVIPGVTGFITLLQNIWTTVSPALTSIADWFVTSALPGIVTFITTSVLPTIQSITDFITGIWTLGGVALTNLQNWFATSGVNTALTGLGDAASGFQNILSGIWSAVQPLLQPIMDFFTSLLSPVQGVIDAISNIGASITGSGNTYGAPPSRDVGGFGVAGQPYLIGAGAQPEVFIPNSDGRFIPNFNNPTTGAGGGGDTYTINVHPPAEAFASNAAAAGYAQDIGAQLRDELRRRG